MRTLLTILVVLSATLPAHALCQMPPDPTIFCGAGTTAVVVDLQGSPSAADGGVEGFVRQIEGDALPGIELGDTIRVVPTATATTFASEQRAGVKMLFILRDVGTWVVGVQVDEGRARVGVDASYTIELQEALALATDEDEEACDQRATEVVEPAIFLGGCDDTYGCASTTTPTTVWALMLPLLLVCRRRRGVSSARSPR